MFEQRSHEDSGITLSRDPLLGEVIDRYRLVEAVGDGAMANVYRAQHTTLTDRRYAVKVLRPNIARKPQVAARFRREARILSQLEHPNIISVIDAGTTPHGLLYMVLDYAEGPTLKDLIRSEEKMSAARTVDIISQILSALKRIHALGYIHRDIKPDNIVVTKSEGKDLVKILDFGIAGMAEADPDMTRLTEVNRICGTPHYMAPEQASASEILAPVDIYALGVILYEILEGRPPFVGPMAEVLVQKLVADPKAPTAGGSLGMMAMSMLSREPEARPTAARLLAQLRSWSPQETMNSPVASVTNVETAPIVEIKHASNWTRAFGQTLVAAGIAGLCAYAGFSMVRSHQSSVQTQESALVSSPIDVEASSVQPVRHQKKAKPDSVTRKKARKASKKVNRKASNKRLKKTPAKRQPTLSDSLARLDALEAQPNLEELAFIAKPKPQAKVEQPTRNEILEFKPDIAKPVESRKEAHDESTMETSTSENQGKTEASKTGVSSVSAEVASLPSEEEVAQAKAELDKIRRRAFSERKRVSAYRMQAN